MTLRFLPLLLLAAAVAGCGGEATTPGTDAGPGLDAAAIDATTPADSGIDAPLEDAATAEDAGDAATPEDAAIAADAPMTPDASQPDGGVGTCTPACAPTEYCDLCPTMNGCVTRPADEGRICPTIYMPVCGCDGRTYSNACALGSAGIGLLHTGECGASG